MKLDMTEVEAAKKLRTTVKGKFNRAANNLDQAIDIGAPIKTIENRYDELKAAWNETQNKHDYFVKLLPSEELDEGWIEDLNKTFSEVEIRTDRYLEDAIKTKEQEMEFKILKETEEAEMKTRQLAETTKKEETEKARETERKRMEELLARRHQEEIKFKKSIEAIEELVASEGTMVVKHLVGVIENAQKRLVDRMISCERAQEDYISSLIDKDVVESESHWIATTLGAYNKACNEVEIFISRNGTEKEASTSHDKPGAGSAGIRLEKVKFDPFRGNLRKYPRFKEEFLKHIKPLYKPSEEAFVLRSYLSDEIKEEIEGLGEDTERIWKRLDKKYGDQGKLVDAIMSEIKKLGKSVDEDPKGTIEMINIIERAQQRPEEYGPRKGDQ